MLSNPTPDSFHLVQTSVIGNGSPYHPNLDAFNASLSLDGRAPYAYIEIPQVHATAQATTIVDQDVSITDLDAFTDYNIAVLQNEDVKLDVKGKTALHEMRFPTNTVNYDKAVTMKGWYPRIPREYLSTNILCQALTNSRDSTSRTSPLNSTPNQTAPTWSALSTSPTPQS